MSCYISSNNERIYCALESSYGVIPVIVGADRIPALKFKAKQVPEQTGRPDPRDNDVRNRHTADGVVEYFGATGIRAAVPMRDGRDAGDLAGRHGGLGDGRNGDRVRGGA
jgi:hypothetical protein